MASSLRDFPEIYWTLSVAKRSIKILESLTKQQERNFDEIMQHSAIAVVFAVTAVESALNTFVSRPILNIQEPDVREFFATLLHRFFRGSMPQKLAFIRLIVPGISKKKALLKSMEKLVSARNSLMHIYPDYLVALGPRLDAQFPLSEDDWIEYPDLQWTKQHVATPEFANMGFSKAIEFIDALPMTLSPYKPMKMVYDSQQKRSPDAKKRHR